MATVLRNTDFEWRGLRLYRERRKVLALVADETYPYLYRIRYPGGWVSTLANLSRAKDAAYGHARHLLAQETGVEAHPSPERAAASAATCSHPGRVICLLTVTPMTRGLPP